MSLGKRVSNNRTGPPSRCHCKLRHPAEIRPQHRVQLMQKLPSAFHVQFSFPKNLGTKSLLRALLQGSWGSFLEEAQAVLSPK